MGKKVKVMTKCGGTFFYDYDQEVESVEIIEPKIYQLQDKLNAAFKALDNTCPGVSCSKCAFQTKRGDCTHVSARNELKKARGYVEEDS